MVMADLLSDVGYAVSRVESGHGAILLLEHSEFDVIVSDWNMDDGNGADIYRWIVQSKPHLAERVVKIAGKLREAFGEKVIIIGFSSHDTEADRQRAQEAGFNHYLPKPVEIKEIERLLQSH